MKKQIKILALSLCLCLSAFSRNYYVSAFSGDNGKDGSIKTPWATMDKVLGMQSTINPGDSIFFKRGESFVNNSFAWTKSGTSANPIYFGAYGTGDNPTFQHTGGGLVTNTALFYIASTNYLVFENLTITDNSQSDTNKVAPAGVGYGWDFLNCKKITVKNCSISKIGVGITYENCDSMIATSNSFSNLKPVKNTASPSYDDFGATGIILDSCKNSSFTKNSFSGCWCYSYDFSKDGGAYELFRGCTNNLFTQNTAFDCCGFAEFGSDHTASDSLNTFAYNIIKNCGLVSWSNIAGTFAVNVSKVYFYNNFILDTSSRYGQLYQFDYNGSPAASTIYTLKNNTFILKNIAVANSSRASKILHTNNLYSLGSGAATNYSLSTGERNFTPSTAFTNYSAGDYSPSNGSALLDSGATVGLSVDFLGNTLAGNGTGVDIGIIEAQAPPSGAMVVTNKTLTAVFYNCKIDVYLSWSVSATNLSKIELQSSTDNSTFTTRLTTTTTTSTSVFSPPSVGTYYFRIKLTGTDNSVSYSTVQSLTL